jgi:hypothetical protein
MRDPSDETRIGAGASARDLSTMAALASDAYATDHAVSLLLEGTARLDDDTPDLPRGTTKRFAWAFRRAYEFGACPATTGDGYATNLALVGGANLALVFEARVEELFRAAVRDDATTHFAPLALADVDLDGVVTLDELGLAPAPADALAGVDFSDETAPRSGADGEPITLADLVYDHLLPRVVRARGGGSCRSELRD